VNMKSVFILLISAACIAAVSGYVSVPSFTATTGTTYYVSTKGSDKAGGSKSTPFRTIAKGLSVVEAGDALEIMGGTYYESWLNPTRSGSAGEGEQIVIRAHGSEKVIVRDSEPRHQWDGIIICTSSVRYVQFENLIIDGAKARGGGKADFGIYVDSHSQNLVFKNVEVRNTRGSGVYIGSSDNTDGTEVPTSIVFDSCFIHDCGTAVVEDHGIYASHVNGLLVVNTVITHTMGWNIQAYPCPTNVRVIHSTLDHAAQGSMVIGGNTSLHCPGAENILVANTLVTNQPNGALDDYGAERVSPKTVRVDTCDFYNNKGNSKGLLYVNNGSKNPFRVVRALKVNPRFVNGGKSHASMSGFATRNKRLNKANPAYTVAYDAAGRSRPAKRATIGAFQLSQ